MTELPNPSQLEVFTNEVVHPVGEVFYGKRATLRVNKPWNENRDILRVKNAAPTFAQNYCQQNIFFLNLIFGLLCEESA